MGNFLDRRLSAGTITLTLIASAYTGLGAFYFASLWSTGTDAFLRWQEVNYVMRGIDPYLVLKGLHAPDPEIGIPGGIYTPWSYITGFALLPPISFPLALTWFGLLNAVALVLVARWGYRLGEANGRWHGVLLASAALASLAVTVTLRHAQYSILVYACLVGVVYFESQKRQYLSGICLAIAMVKPQIAALFFFVLVVRRSWGGCLVAAAILGLETLMAAYLVDVDAWTLVTQMASEGASYDNAYIGILHGTLNLGFSRRVLLAVGMLLGALATGLLCWRYRARSPLVLSAIAAVFTTLWSYHRTVDLLVVGLLVVALGEAAGRLSHGRAWTVFSIVGVSFWMPHMNLYYTAPFLPEAFRFVWIAGLVYLLSQTFAASRENVGSVVSGR